MAAKKSVKNKNFQLSLFECIAKELEKQESDENPRLITNILRMKTGEYWRGLIALPGGTLLGDIVLEFDKETNIPLEIPFFTFFHYVSALLLNKNITIKVNKKDDRRINPDIWTILLAVSGSAKSWTNGTIKYAIPDLEAVSHDLDGTQSTAKFVMDLQENNRKLYLRDEFAELYQQMKSLSGPMAQFKDYLLHIYNNDTIRWDTKHDDPIIIEKAAISFLGMTVEKMLASVLNAEDLINGFVQRFSFIRALKDKNKKMEDYPVYDIDMKGWKEKWDNLVASIKHDYYIVNDNADKTFRSMFRSLARCELDESFYRRQLWKAHKYALIYHIILGKGEQQEIDPQDYDWASKIVYLTLEDFKNILTEYDKSDVAHILELVENLYIRFKKEGKIVTPRDVVQRIRAIKNVNEAKSIMSIIDKNILEEY